MRERIFSLEVEYGISFLSERGSGEPTKETLVGVLRRALTDAVGLSESSFITTGAKFYHDVGHAEWAHPECRSAREIALYDKAADTLIAFLLPRAQEFLQAEGFRGRILIIKNNVDVHGNTYGCHENYMAERETAWLDHEDYLRLSIRYLVPFLATRLILCAPGRIGLGRRGEQGFAFQLGQRADFINAVVSRDTRDMRGIFNLGRENEPFSEGNYRRLHLILGDACMSGYGTFLKLGTVGLLLRLLEDLEIGEIPHLKEPVRAMQTVSRDPSCTALLPLYDGRQMTAIDIQRIYLEQVMRYAERHPTSPEERELILLWAETLDALQNAPSRLFGKVDWITKKSVLDRLLAQNGLSWETPDLERHPIRYKLQELDIQYHNIDPAQSLFYKLLRSQRGAEALDTLWDAESVRVAQSAPPPYTRARVRGEVIASARRTGGRVEVKGWSEVRLGGQRVELYDPFTFFSAETYTILKEGRLTSA
jgi:proteasome accessory factor A